MTEAHQQAGEESAGGVSGAAKASLNTEFVGGPPELFDVAGREQLIVLHALTFDSYVLDIGCGVLRGGRWIIPLLKPRHYFGIEPQRHMVERGLTEFMDPSVVALKDPQFDYNERFDFSVFGTSFTHFLARSVWTHASKPQIEAMLEGVAPCGTSDAVLLTSLFPSSWRRRDYQGADWIGRNAAKEETGMVAHRMSWISQACAQRGLSVKLLGRPPLTPHGQVWAVVRRANAARA